MSAEACARLARNARAPARIFSRVDSPALLAPRPPAATAPLVGPRGRRLCRHRDVCRVPRSVLLPLVTAIASWQGGGGALTRATTTTSSSSAASASGAARQPAAESGKPGGESSGSIEPLPLQATKARPSPEAGSDAWTKVERSRSGRRSAPHHSRVPISTDGPGLGR